jgi:hypothetical protein
VITNKKSDWFIIQIICNYRYVFRNAKRVGLQELGPRFTMKLRTLQKGSFDSKFGEYEFIHKVFYHKISLQKS